MGGSRPKKAYEPDANAAVDRQLNAFNRQLKESAAEFDRRDRRPALSRRLRRLNELGTNAFASNPFNLRNLRLKYCCQVLPIILTE